MPISSTIAPIRLTISIGETFSRWLKIEEVGQQFLYAIQDVAVGRARLGYFAIVASYIAAAWPNPIPARQRVQMKKSRAHHDPTLPLCGVQC
jgi:hypothetical protein